MVIRVRLGGETDISQRKEVRLPVTESLPRDPLHDAPPLAASQQYPGVSIATVVGTLVMRVNNRLRVRHVERHPGEADHSPCPRVLLSQAEPKSPLIAGRCERHADFVDSGNGVSEHDCHGQSIREHGIGSGSNRPQECVFLEETGVQRRSRSPQGISGSP